jgi:hypothetical protein
MKQIFFISARILILSVMVIIFSCKDKDANPELLFLSPWDSDFVFSADGEEFKSEAGVFMEPKISVYTNLGAWEVSSSQPWITVTKTGDESFTLSAQILESNQSPEIAQVIVKTSTMQSVVNIRQTIERLIVTPANRTIVFSANGTATSGGSAFTPTFDVNTNMESWNIVSDQPSWLSVNKQGNSFTLVATNNTGEKPRPSAKVTVTAGEAKPVVINVKQNSAGFEDITADYLKNTTAPFVAGAMMLDNRFYAAVDWKANAALAINGNVDLAAQNYLILITWTDWTPAQTVKNGKLYQTIELEAGTYRFDASLIQAHANDKSFVVAALGNDIPDTENVEQESLSFVEIPAGVTNRLLSTTFVLQQKSTVSLGFLANLSGSALIYFDKIELLKVL